MRACTYPGCDRPVNSRDLCLGHYTRLKDGSTLAGPIQTAEILVAEPVMPCPDNLLWQAAACADLDAKAIVRLIWPHFLEASLAHLEPFTLAEQVS